jgi:hypothetical protein
MFAALFLAAAIRYPLDAPMLGRADVRACFEQVLKGGGYGHLPFESAAFLIAKDGGYECAVWPRSIAFHSQSWPGRMPESTVAIIHSHPAELPDPSWRDVRLAERLRIPIFVVTPRAILRAGPGS